MQKAGYTDLQRGERGSSEEHLMVTQFKVEQENERLRQAQELSSAHLAAVEEYRRRKADMEQKAQSAQRKLDAIAPQVDDFEHWAQQFSGELEMVLPEVKWLESAKSYREKKVKPLLAKVIDMLKALYREFLALKNRYFALEKQYHQVMNKKNRLSKTLSKMEAETTAWREDAGKFQRLRRALGPENVEEALQIDRQNQTQIYNQER